MIIILMGYMASGKSTYGKILSNKLNYSFIDLDDYIEEKESLSVSRIFKTKGEIYFRKKETEYLNALLKNETNLILSLGGGTPCYGNNMDAILKAENVVSVYLKASIKTLINNLKDEKSQRPLIADIKTDELLAEFIGKHLFERAYFYNQADKIVDTDNKSVEDIIKDLLSAII
ncbi:shikimate kinase [Oceanihabitans sp. IOP_32]|uniref:shikimate kinase n=1 Tax=Oceanihabitans sp. IOP_32 TaxID=2529032 RepID=UPI0012940B41|nr:shikimate kinase [Oceanihabitans sp. IOP_32]QFZ55643.1 shikimate kinase [Oceanihabitans sp. IOP_32]